MAVGPTIVQPPKTDGIPQGGTAGPTERFSTGQVTPTKPVESHRLAQATSWFGETDNLTSRQNRTRCVTETGPAFLDWHPTGGKKVSGRPLGSRAENYRTSSIFTGRRSAAEIRAASSTRWVW
jgi:hypothetical protein